MRWVVFDDDTAEAVVTRLRRGAAEIQHTDPLDAALNSPHASLVLLPSRIAGRLLVARFPASKVVRPSMVPALTTVPPKRPPTSRKSWWNKLTA